MYNYFIQFMILLIILVLAFYIVTPRNKPKKDEYNLGLYTTKEELEKVLSFMLVNCVIDSREYMELYTKALTFVTR